MRMSNHIARFLLLALLAGPVPAERPPIHVAFMWHMHQPIYWPHEDIVTTSRNPRNTLDVLGILSWPDRVGAYTHYPVDAIGDHGGLPHFGAQVSFSGSLIEDIEAMAAAGITYGAGWKDLYRQGARKRTAGGNPRLDMVGFAYHHPLMTFLTYEENRDQMRRHREALASAFGTGPSRGFFPPENAFGKDLIPALVDEGFEWVLVDNVHMDRASKAYPYTMDQKIPPPNPADQRNAPQARYVPLHCQTNTVQAVGGDGRGAQLGGTGTGGGPRSSGRT